MSRTPFICDTSPNGFYSHFCDPLPNAFILQSIIRIIKTASQPPKSWIVLLHSISTPFIQGGILCQLIILRHKGGSKFDFLVQCRRRRRAFLFDLVISLTRNVGHGVATNELYPKALFHGFQSCLLCDFWMEYKILKDWDFRNAAIDLNDTVKDFRQLILKWRDSLVLWQMTWFDFMVDEGWCWFRQK